MTDAIRTKQVSLQAMTAIAETLRASGKTLVFTNGCFDILHAGHVNYLADAAAQGDVLVLGLNSDASVKQIKGEKRPVISQDQRAVVLSALACIDYIVIFDEPDPGNLIKILKPDVLVKGADWAESDIIGADTVLDSGGRVSRIPLEPDISTTIIINRIVKLFGC